MSLSTNTAPGRRRMTEIFVRGAGGKQPRTPVRIDSLTNEALGQMSPQARAYLAGGAGSEDTARRNRRAFERWRIVPRMLAGILEVDLSVEILGRRWPVPIALSPVGVLELFHRQADLAVARAAAAESVPMIFSNQASVAMETCAEAMSDSPRWFQLYWSSDEELVSSFLERAETCDCEAVVVTLDTSTLGWRPRDLELGSLPFLRGMGLAQYLTDPVFRRKLGEPLDLAIAPPKPPFGLAMLGTAIAQILRFPGSLREKLSTRPMLAVRRFLATYSHPSLTWEDLAWLRERTRLPILLKGILAPDDARRALDHGVDGLFVSNHGGRQVDGAISAFEALPRVLEVVAGRIPVLIDSGIRSGSDIFKALALGASATGIGRPFVYGLALDGEQGVREVLRNLIAELELTTLLAGHRSLSELGPEALLATEW